MRTYAILIFKVKNDGNFFLGKFKKYEVLQFSREECLLNT